MPSHSNPHSFNSQTPIFRPILLLLLLVVASSMLPWAHAVSFDLTAVHENSYAMEQYRKCFTMYFGKDVMVLGKVNTPSVPGQRLFVEVKDGDGNVLYSKRNAENENKIVFTTHSYSDYETCFINYLDANMQQRPEYFRSVRFEMDYSSEFDENTAQVIKDQKLKPIEAELKSLERIMEDLVDEIDYLKKREITMRDTNESTNDRVKWFSIFSMVVLIASGVWQVVYLRHFFQTKKIL